MHRYRKWVTTGVAFTFVVVGVTGVCFKLFFRNHTLEEIHGWIGLLLVAAAVGHIYQHWGSLRRHLRDWRVFLLAVPIVLIIAGSSFGDQHEPGTGINPREIIHKLSQASAANIATVFGKDINTVLASMKRDGLHVEGSDESVEQLARANQKPPEGILTYFTN